MPYFQASSGIDWHYLDEGQGEDLLFLHGWGVDHRIWRQQVKYFSCSYRVIAIDLPGHGQSSWEDVSLGAMSVDVTHLLQRLNVRKVVLIASSLGGMLAIKLYEHFSQQIKQFVFVGSMPKFSKSKEQPFGLDITKIKKLRQQLQEAYPSIIHIFFRSLFTYEERQSRRYRWLQKFRENQEVPFQGALGKYLDILAQEDLTPTFKKITQPIQFINGREDPICPQEAVEFLQNLSARMEFYFFEKCGHFPFLSQPHEFNAVLEKFLNNDS